MMKKPNILWIMTDQQSANMMSCAGNPWVHTPAMDSIARDGVRFSQAYCVNPVCLPSRLGMLTGLYPGDAAIYTLDHFQASPGLPAAVTENGLGTLLKRHGYNAVYGGKEHLPYTTAADLGFDKLCTDERGGLAEQFAGYIRSYRDEKPFAMVASFIDPHDICFMAILDAAEQGVTGNFPKDFLKNAPAEAINCRAAQALPPDMDEEEFFAAHCPPLPDNYLPAPDEPEAIALLQAERDFKQFARECYTDRQWRLHRWAYKNLTEKVDGQIGILLDALRESGRWEDTVIIFTSDHGDMDAAHKMEHKECLYEECCRIPLLIKGVGAAAAHEPGLVCNGLDLYPTVLDYAGIPLPEYLEGYSLKGRVQGTAPLHHRDVLVVECENGHMALDGSGKLVRYDRGARAEQFYELAENPGEMYDQSGDARFAQRIAALRRAIDTHIAARPGRFGIHSLSPRDVQYTECMAFSDFMHDEAVLLHLQSPLKEKLTAFAGTRLPVMAGFAVMTAEEKAAVQTLLAGLRAELLQP